MIEAMRILTPYILQNIKAVIHACNEGKCTLKHVLYDSVLHSRHELVYAGASYKNKFIFASGSNMHTGRATPLRYLSLLMQLIDIQIISSFEGLKCR